MSTGPWIIYIIEYNNKRNSVKMKLLTLRHTQLCNKIIGASFEASAAMQWETANEHRVDQLAVGESVFDDLEPDVVVLS
jgi:hypothetical protein